jgi:hypothetical protein
MERGGADTTTELSLKSKVSMRVSRVRWPPDGRKSRPRSRSMPTTRTRSPIWTASAALATRCAAMLPPRFALRVVSGLTQSAGSSLSLDLAGHRGRAAARSWARLVDDREPAGVAARTLRRVGYLDGEAGA